MIKQYEKDGYLIIEYESGAVIKQLISNTNSTPTLESTIEVAPTLEEMQTQTLLNTEYLVIMSELTNV